MGVYVRFDFRFASFSKLALVGVFSLTIGCGKTNSNQREGLTQYEAAASIEESFGAGIAHSTGLPSVKIQKDALEKEFLLQGTLIEQPIAALGTSIRSRIVVFKRRGTRLYMLEATQGHSVTLDLPQNLILAEFPITKETPSTIEFDFNAGMTAIFQAADWTGQDAKGRDYSPSFDMAQVRLSYLEEVKVAPTNQLIIRQIAQLKMPAGILQGEQILPVEVRYFLSPYRASASFQAFGETDHKNVGFFEVATRLKEDGSQEVHSVKFDSKKPIVFAVSANTPAEYRDAVRDGILYWKEALPSIVATSAPAGATAPDFEHNIIQWVNHDRAGMAYADAQMDPRTGEVLHAQAFITSAFGFGSAYRVRKMLRSLESDDKKPVTTPHASLSGFESKRLCEIAPGEALQRTLSELLSAKASEATILRAAQDYVRATVAHEVGHLLGLRHNFAGSLQTKNYPFADREKIFRQYLVDDTVPADMEVGSSEMDYLPTEDSILHGHQMRKPNGKVYAHDRLAIEVLYLGKALAGKDLPPFCSDTGLGKYTDCRQHDFGTSQVEFTQWAANKALSTLPSEVIETFLSAKAPPPWEVSKPVESVNINAQGVARTILLAQQNLVEALASSKFSLLVARTFPYVGSLNEDQVKEQQLLVLEAEVKKAGGWEQVLPLIVRKSFEEIYNETDRKLRDPYYLEGIGAGGQKYQLSAQETDSILTAALELVLKLPNLVAIADTEILKKIPETMKVGSTPTGDELAKLFHKRANQYLLARKGSTINAEAEITLVLSPADPTSTVGVVGSNPITTSKSQLRLPEFFYSQEAREKASTLLSIALPLEANDWAANERKQLKEDFKKLLDTGCGCNFETVAPEKIKIADATTRRKVTRWFNENKKILRSLP